MLFATLSACAFGVANGVRHAIEPDHVAAVGTFVARGDGARGAVRYAAAWGAGHGITLTAFAVPLAIAGASLPRGAARWFEIVVVATLVVLGVRGLVQALRSSSSPVPRASSAAEGGTRFAFAIGLIHGLAGSGSLTALVAVQLPSATLMAAFIALYALGAALGMCAFAGALGIPLARAVRARRGATIVTACAATASLLTACVLAVTLD